MKCCACAFFKNMEIQGMPQCKMNCNHVSFPLEQSSFQKLNGIAIIPFGLPPIDPFGYERISSVYGNFVRANFRLVKLLPDAEKWIKYIV